MKKFFSLELKRSRYFLAFLAVFALIFSLITNFIFKIYKASELGLALGFYCLVGLVFLINLLYFTSRYRKDLFSKSSYFTFSINVSTGKIILSKLLAGALLSLLSLFVFVRIFFIFTKAFGLDGMALKSSFDSSVLISLILYWLLAYVYLTVALSLSKVKIFNKYYDFVTIVLAVVFLVLVMGVMRNLYRLKPTIIDLTDFSIRNLTRINGVDFFMVYYDINHRAIGLNLWILLLTVFLIIFGFFINVYLVEEKIDL